MKKLTIFLTFWLVACGSKSILSSNSDSGGFHLRPHTEETLPNGLKIIYIVDSTLPKVRLNLLLKVGAINDPKGQEGLGYLTSSLIEDGTTKMTATQVADEFGFIAADYSSSTDHEKTLFSVSVLNPNRESALKLFSSILMGPAFSNQEINRRKSRLIASLKKITENPSGYADLVFNQTVFSQHPYGRRVSGTPKTIEGLSRADISRHYFKYYRPENAWLAVSGDVDENFKQMIRKAFGGWSSGSVVQEVHAAPVDNGPLPLKLVDKKGLQQTQIRIGGLGISRQDPDHLALRLASLIFGGTFESRLMKKIRAEMGLTYSISSGFNELKDGGSFEVSTFSRHDKAAEVIKQARVMIDEFVKKGVTSSELDAAKTLMVSQFPGSVETAGETAGSLLNLRFYNIPDSYLENFEANVRKLSVSDVNQAIQKHLRPELFKTVVFSDATQVGESLRGLGEMKVEPVEL